MKTPTRSRTVRSRIAVRLATLVALVLLLGACGLFGGERASTTYPLDEVGDSGVSGTVTFTKLGESRTEIAIDLEGVDGGMHPAHIHEGDITPGGGIYLTLGEVGSDGESTVVVSNADDNAVGNGDPVTYESLLAYDGYVNVHLSRERLGIFIARGEIGAGAEPVSGGD